MVKLIILDMDDTIYNYKYANDISTQAIIKFTSEKYNISFELLLSKYKEAKKIINKRFNGIALAHDKQLQIKQFIDILNIADNKILFAHNLYQIYLNTFLDNIKCFDDLYTFLNLCKINKIKVVILTNNTLDIQMRIFEKIYLEKYIDDMITSYEIGAEKPDKKCFFYILQKYNISEKDTIIIGDSYENDYMGGLNIGIKSILYDNYKNIINELFHINKYVSKN